MADGDRFDAEHCGRIAPRIERMIAGSYHAIVLSDESKKKIVDLGTSSIVYASLHKSHFDYIAVCLKFFLEGLPYPRTIAGTNLLTGIIGRLVKHLTKIDMMKWGAVPMERTSSISRNLFDICSRMEVFLRSDKPILAFPEMEIISDGEIKSIKTGRAYSGKIRKFASSLFRPAINVSKEGKKVYILPIAVSYDFVAEDSYFGWLAKADKLRRSENGLTSFGGKLYYVFLELHFFHKMYLLGRGNIYIDTGQPIPVEPKASKKELALRAQEGAARCYRVTMPALVCYAISKGASQRGELDSSLEKYIRLLNEKGANFHPPLALNQSTDEALEELAQRKVISYRNGISVRKLEIINYYTNTIAHHFEGNGYTWPISKTYVSTDVRPNY